MRIGLIASTVILSIVTASAHAAAPVTECWKATFTEQLSGQVEHGYSSGPTPGYIESYDGIFRWRGKPTTTTAHSEYVFCLRERVDDGGVLFVNGKPIEFDRVGSIKRPKLVMDTPNWDYDGRPFPTLYAVFRNPGQPETSMEIKLEPLKNRVFVITDRIVNKKRMMTYMQGVATEAPVPSASP